MDIKLKLKNFLKHFFLIDDSPVKVAAGAALGVFLGVIPGAGIIAVIALSSLLRFNRLAAVSAVLAVNTWITVLIMPLAAGVGGFLFGIEPEILIDDFYKNYEIGWRSFFEETIIFSLLLPLVAGFVLVSLALSLLVYFSLYFLLKYHKLRFK